MSGEAVYVCAHGAGGHMDDRGMVRVAQALAGVGFDVVRFNFPYREQGSRRPDSMPVLKESIVSVVSRVRAERNPRRLILGGRSMGGRAASMLAAEGFACDGLLLLAYPLHPPGQLGKLRSAHLPQIAVPVLCFCGTRDPLCDQELMKGVVKSPSWEMHWLEGANHSFQVLKSSGRTEDDVYREVAEVSREWLSRLA